VLIGLIAAVTSLFNRLSSLREQNSELVARLERLEQSTPAEPVEPSGIEAGMPVSRSTLPAAAASDASPMTAPVDTSRASVLNGRRVLPEVEVARDAGRPAELAEPAAGQLVQQLITQPQMSQTSQPPLPQPLPDETSSEKVESILGTKVIGIVAAVLVFLGFIFLGILAFPYMTDMIKVIILFVLSLGMSVAGIALTAKRRNGFTLALLGCGLGSVFISVLLTHLVFSLITYITAYLLLFLWLVVCLIISLLLQTLTASRITYTGLVISVVFGFLGAVDVSLLILLTVYQLVSSALIVLSNLVAPALAKPREAKEPVVAKPRGRRYAKAAETESTTGSTDISKIRISMTYEFSGLLACLALNIVASLIVSFTPEFCSMTFIAENTFTLFSFYGLQFMSATILAGMLLRSAIALPKQQLGLTIVLVAGWLLALFCSFRVLFEVLFTNYYGMDALFAWSVSLRGTPTDLLYTTILQRSCVTGVVVLMLFCGSAILFTIIRWHQLDRQIEHAVITLSAGASAVYLLYEYSILLSAGLYSWSNAFAAIEFGATRTTIALLSSLPGLLIVVVVLFLAFLATRDRFIFRTSLFILLANAFFVQILGFVQLAAFDLNWLSLCYILIELCFLLLLYLFGLRDFYRANGGLVADAEADADVAEALEQSAAWDNQNAVTASDLSLLKLLAVAILQSALVIPLAYSNLPLQVPNSLLLCLFWAPCLLVALMTSYSERPVHSETLRGILRIDQLVVILVAGQALLSTAENEWLEVSDSFVLFGGLAYRNLPFPELGICLGVALVCLLICAVNLQRREHSGHFSDYAFAIAATMIVVAAIQCVVNIFSHSFILSLILMLIALVFIIIGFHKNIANLRLYGLILLLLSILKLLSVDLSGSSGIIRVLSLIAAGVICFGVSALYNFAVRRMDSVHEEAGTAKETGGDEGAESGEGAEQPDDRQVEPPSAAQGEQSAEPPVSRREARRQRRQAKKQGQQSVEPQVEPQAEQQVEPQAEQRGAVQAAQQAAQTQPAAQTAQTAQAPQSDAPTALNE